MSEKYKVGENIRPHFVTITTVDWVDVFTRLVYKDIIIDSLNYCIEAKDLGVYAYCIMPSHVHLIVSSDIIPLQAIMRDMKKFTSKSIINAINEGGDSRKEWLLRKFAFAAQRIKRGVNYKVWQDGFHPIELTSNKLMEQKLDYLHNNPVTEGYVYQADYWVYSSAGYYSGRVNESMVALQMLE